MAFWDKSKILEVSSLKKESISLNKNKSKSKESHLTLDVYEIACILWYMYLYKTGLIFKRVYKAISDSRENRKIIKCIVFKRLY